MKAPLPARMRGERGRQALMNRQEIKLTQLRTREKKKEINFSPLATQAGKNIEKVGAKRAKKKSSSPTRVASGGRFEKVKSKTRREKKKLLPHACVAAWGNIENRVRRKKKCFFPIALQAGRNGREYRKSRAREYMEGVRPARKRAGRGE